MRTSEDALRSVRKWFGTVLPAPWDIQFSREELERPSVFIIQASPEQNDGSAYVRDVEQDYDAFVYPVGFEDNPARSRLEANQIRQTLTDAMTRGFQPVVPGPYYSYAMRMPIFDYEGISWDQGVSPVAAPYDFYPVSNWTADVRVDPDDDSLFNIVVGLRLSWRADGDVRRHQGPTLLDLTTNFGPTP